MSSSAGTSGHPGQLTIAAWLFDTNTDNLLRSITTAGGTTTPTTGAAVSTMSKFEALLTPGQIEFKVDGVTFGTHTTNLPADAVLTPYARVQARAGSSKACTFDLFDLVSNALSR